jgi:hypothetical protein
VGKGVCGHGLYGATFTLQMDSTAPHYLAMCYPYTYTELQVNHMHPCIHASRNLNKKQSARVDTNPRFLSVGVSDSMTR